MSNLTLDNIIAYLHSKIQDARIVVLLIEEGEMLSRFYAHAAAEGSFGRLFEDKTVLTAEKLKADGAVDSEIGEIAGLSPWLRPEARCSAHASWIACGPLAEELLSGDTVTGNDDHSPLSLAAARDCSVVLIGDAAMRTLIPWFEEVAQVPHRYWKKHEPSVSGNGHVVGRTCFSYELREGVRTANSIDHIRRLPGQSWDIEEFDGFPVGVIPLHALRQAVHRELKENSGYFLETDVQDTGRKDNPVLRLDHIGIVSKYEKKIAILLDLLGAHVAYEGMVEAIGVHCRYFAHSNVDIEIVTPIEDDSIVSRHREKFPFNPLHHIAFEVRSLEEGVAHFRDKGYHPIDGRVMLAPKPYHRVVFLSPVQTGGLLIELVADEGKDYKVYGGIQEDVWTI